MDVNNIDLVFNILMAIVGIGFLITSMIFILVRNHNKKVCTISTTAEFVKMKWHRRINRFDYDKRGGWFPVYKYYIDGEEITVISNICYANKNKFKPGQRIEIHVNPNNHEKFYADDNAMSVLTKVFSSVGVLLLLLSVYLYYFI